MSQSVTMKAVLCGALGRRQFHASAAALIKNYATSDKRGKGRAAVTNVVATVFGASSFSGRHVINALGSAGTRVVTPFRGDGIEVRDLKLSGELGQIVPIYFQLDDEELLKRAIRHSNVVVNLIGSWKTTKNWTLRETNLEGAARIARLARECGHVDRFVQVSCLGASMQSPSEFFRVKAEAEQAVISEFPSANIVRCGPMWGADDHFINNLGVLASQAVIPRYNGGVQRMQPVSFEDVAKAVVNIVYNPETHGQLYELAGDKIFTQDELMMAVRRVLGRDSDFYPLVNEIELYGPDDPLFRLVSEENRQKLVDMVKHPDSLGLRDLGVDQPESLSAHLANIVSHYEINRI